MSLELTDWDKDLPSQADEEYQALVRTLNFTEGFGLLFVRCSPAGGEQLISKLKVDISNKNIQALRLQQAVHNLYEIIYNLDNKAEINVLFITGLEHSFYEYEECKSLTGWNSKDIYSYSWKDVPPVLINLNQQRERLKDNFNICFVFLLPIFAIKYFIQRAPDFFDWRSGLFEFPLDSETLEHQSSRIIQEEDDEKFLALTPEERTQKIIAIQELIAEDNQTSDRQYDLLISLGKLQSAGHNYKESLASFEQAINIRHDKHEAWYNKGNSLIKLGKDEELTPALKKLIKIKNENNSDLYKKDNLVNDLIMNIIKEAVNFSDEEVVKIELDEHQVIYKVKTSQRNFRRYEEAISSYDKAIEINPNDHLTWYNRGNVLQELERYEESISSYDKAIEINPNDHLTWYNRGNVLQELERYEESISSYDKAIEINPNDHLTWYNRGNVLQELGRYEEAISSYDKALVIEPTHYQSWQVRGITLFNLERYEEAISSYKQALKFNQDYHQAWHNLGISLNSLGRYTEAITSYSKAQESDPSCCSCWIHNGIALSNLGRNEEAISSYEKALSIQPGDCPAWGNRGIALSNLGRYEEAISSYDKVLSIKADDNQAFYNRGCALFHLGRYEEAIASYDKALEIQPDYHDAWYGRGIALENLGRYEEAIASYDKALEIQPDYHLAWYSRGIILRKLGRWKEGFASVNKAIEINPDFASVLMKQLLARIQQKLGWKKLTQAWKGLLNLTS